MKADVAYLILAHTDPVLLRRLILTIAAPWALVFVHIDRKVPITPFQELIGDLSNVIFVRDRVPVYWAGWSQVQATLNLIEEAYDSSPRIKRFVLLSGDSYPVKPRSYLRSVFLGSDREYISLVPMPNEFLAKPLTRLSQFYLEGGDRVAGLRAQILRGFNKVALWAPPRNVTAMLGGLTPHAGSQWWALTREAIERVRDVRMNQPELTTLFSRSHCPDESFFHTILGGGGACEKFARSLVYADWSDELQRPCEIVERHVPLLLNGVPPEDVFGFGPACFARKFSSRNPEVLAIIDQAIKAAEIVDPFAIRS